jgi:predicted acylesterase/phospholipase RssA
MASMPGHTPPLAAGGVEPSGESPRRSLVLAGGGMRVAYQAGVLRALSEAGLHFHHADGTSGGIMNLAMILSGQDAVEMGERWRTLDQRQFMSLLPLRQYVRSFRWAAFGSADGVRHRVFPHLGIDVERVRSAQGMVGTFNVCNFSQKIAEVIEHCDIDLDLLVAGISLPMLMPAVTHNGDSYLDAVWIRDSNVVEAVRRGADEVWLVWCIGNTPEYVNGSFRQYVHMIEVAANASLYADFEQVRRVNKERPAPVVLHLIKPESPIPLDPDYFLGRIDAATLVEMGYRDGCRYLDRLDPAGVAWAPGATAMRSDPPALSVRPEFTGHLGGRDLAVRLAPEIPDATALKSGSRVDAPATGHATAPSLGTRVPFRAARVTVTPGGRLSFEAALEGPDGRYCLAGSAVTGSPRLPVSLCRGERQGGAVVAEGELCLDRRAAWSALRTSHVTHVGSSGDRWRVMRALARVVLHQARLARRTSRGHRHSGGPRVLP